jgi:hypothetical protein
MTVALRIRIHEDPHEGSAQPPAIGQVASLRKDAATCTRAIKKCAKKSGLKKTKVVESMTKLNVTKGQRDGHPRTCGT